MTVPVAVDSESARAAVLASRQTDGLVMLVPRIDGRYAKVGTVAHIEESGRLPGRRQTSISRHFHPLPRSWPENTGRSSRTCWTCAARRLLDRCCAVSNTLAS